MSEIEPTSLGKKLRRLRVERGLLQSDFNKIGLSSGYISLLEKGLRSPSAKALKSICDLLQVSQADLVIDNNVSLTSQDEATLTQIHLGLQLEKDLPYEKLLESISNPGKQTIQWALAEAEVELVFGKSLSCYQSTDKLLSQNFDEASLSEKVKIIKLYGAATSNLGLEMPAVAALLGIWSKLSAQDSEILRNLLSSMLVTRLGKLGDLASARFILEQLGNFESILNPEARRNAFWAASNLALNEGKFEESRLLAQEALLVANGSKALLVSSQLEIQYFIASISDPSCPSEVLRAVKTELESRLSESKIDNPDHQAALEFKTLLLEIEIRLGEWASAAEIQRILNLSVVQNYETLLKVKVLSAWLEIENGQDTQAQAQLEEAFTMFKATPRNFEMERLLALATNLASKFDDVGLLKLALSAKLSLQTHFAVAK